MYLNFTKISPPAPNDPLVDEASQLNSNWDLLDSKMQPYIAAGFISGAEVGQEWYDTNNRFVVWNGSATRAPDDTIQAGWSAWTALPITASRSIRPSFTPRWRNNSILRKVELAGGVQWDSAADPWTLGSLAVFNTDTTGSPSSSLAPIGGKAVRPCASALSASTTVVAGGYVVIDVGSGWTHVRIQCQYLGGPGGGNFLMLDQVSWWY